MGYHSGITGRRSWGIAWLRIPRRLSIALAIALGGCAPHSTVTSTAEPAAQICHPSPALLVPPSAPDCAFRQSALRTIDPGEFSRLKVEYEMKCYQSAERAVRQRLRLLQAANRCEVASARQ
jgi:hypothetical protein